MLAEQLTRNSIKLPTILVFVSLENMGQGTWYFYLVVKNEQIFQKEWKKSPLIRTKYY